MDLPVLIVLSVVFALAIVVMMARWPVGATLGIYAFLLPFDSILNVGQLGHIHLHLTWFAGAAATAVLLTRGLLEREFLPPPRTVLWLTAVVFWAVMSSFWAINVQNSVYRLPILALLLLLYFAGVSVHITEKELDVVIGLAILGGCVAASLSLLAFVRGETWLPPPPPIIEETTGRGTLSAGSRITDPNILGAALILPLSLALGWLLAHRDRSKRLLMIGAVAVIGTSICATMSRGALVATVVVFLVYLLRYRIKRHIVVPIAILASIFFAMPQVFFLRLGGALEDRGAGRLDIWTVAFQAIKHRTFLGAGLDCFPDAYNEHAQYAHNFVGFNRAPHNIYLGTFVELGLVGLLLLVGTLARHFLTVAKARRAPTDELLRVQLISYEAAGWGLLVCGFFLDIFWEEYFWLTLMLLIIGSRVCSAEQGSYLYRRRVESHYEQLPELSTTTYNTQAHPG